MRGRADMQMCKCANVQMIECIGSDIYKQKRCADLIICTSPHLHICTFAYLHIYIISGACSMLFGGSDHVCRGLCSI